MPENHTKNDWVPTVAADLPWAPNDHLGRRPADVVCVPGWGGRAIYPASGLTWGWDELSLVFLALLTKRAKCQGRGQSAARPARPPRQSTKFWRKPLRRSVSEPPFFRPHISVGYHSMCVVGSHWVWLDVVKCRWMSLDVVVLDRAGC